MSDDENINARIMVVVVFVAVIVLLILWANQPQMSGGIFSNIVLEL